MKNLIPQSIKNIYHLLQAALANVWFGFPSKKLKVIGVTGTNGKTTTVQMIAKILEEAGFRVAVASTINFKIGEKEWVNDMKLTTFSSFRLQDFLRKATRAGCEYAVVEVTSHALDQYRVWGVDFDVAVITNVTREHLDYHGTIEEYRQVKEKLFGKLARLHRYAKHCGQGKSGKSVAIVNLNMADAEEFLKYPAGEKYGYAVKISNFKFKISNQFQNLNFKTVFAENIELNIQNTRYQIPASPAGGQDTSFQINLPGEFNVENALAATCVGLSQGISLEEISQALAKIKGIPGRMERIENDRRLEIIVDYAVTPDSLQKLYDYVSKLKKENSRIIAVFGACGERDRGKRPIMGKIVAKIADFCIITNEDPYKEDPQQIIDEVFEGVSKYRRENMNAWRILDRREAIKKALELARADDIVVVTGKGAEETMAVGNERIPWNDPRAIREVLSELSKEKNQ